MTCKTLCCALLVCGFVWGQETTATLSGVIADPQGSPVPGAMVQARNTDTNVSRRFVTGEQGLYSIPFLSPGPYEVRVEAKGFRAFVQANVLLELGQRKRADLVLAVGEVSDAVTVTDAPPLLDQGSATIGQTIDARALTQIPNLNRNPLNVVYLAPTAVPNNFDRQSTTPAATMSSINGMRPDDNETLIDGGSTISPSSNIAVLSPSIDAVAEVRTETNTYSAEFGRVMGGVVNVTTKSGTNAFHATVVEFHRNAALNSRNFFDPRKPRYTRNQFGLTFSGPVVLPKLYNGKDRSFFLASYEGTRQVQGLTNIGTVATQAQRGGNFAGRPLLFDPLTTATRDGSLTRLAFPNNVIPGNRFDSVARRVLDFYPTPTGAGTVNNFVLALPTTTVVDRWTVRGDQYFGSRNRLMLRWMYENPRNSTTNSGPRTLPDARVDPSLPQQPLAQQAVVSDTHTFSPNTVNDFRATFFRFFSTQLPGSLNQNFPAELGLRGVDQASLFPRMDFTGYQPIGHNSVNNTRQNLFSWADTVSHLRGVHSLRFGASVTRFQFNNGSRGAQSGAFNFSVLPTAQVGSGTTGEPFASFLLGLPINSSLETIRPTFGYRYTNYSFFLQDDIRISRELTLNLGMRYEVETPLVEVNDLQSTFDLTRNAFVFAGREGTPRRLSDTDWSNLGPRIGLAWSRGSWVVRSGVGVAYGSTSSSQVQQNRSTGFTAVASYPSPDNGITLPIKLDQGVPPLTVDPLTVTRQRNISVNVTERKAPRANAIQWNLTLQRQWGGLVVETGYAASKGTHLVAASYTVNQVPTALLGAGNSQARRPYPDLQDVIVNNPNEGNSHYHAAFVSVNRRLAAGLTVISSFTFQKSIDSTAGRGAFVEYGQLRPQDNYNRAAERSLSQFDRTKRFVAGWTYDLPSRKSLPSVGRLLLGGWQVSGMFEAMDGTPLAMSSAPNRSNSLGGGSRPNRVAGQSPILSSWTSQRAFNTDAYAAQPAFAFGDVSRTEPQLRAPGWVTLDASAAKIFPLRERAQLQFRFEGFNVTNRTNFQRPNTVQGTPQFGQIVQAWPSRNLQLALRLIF